MKPYLDAVHRFLTIIAVAFVVGSCGKRPEAETGRQSLSPIEATSTTLEELKQRPPFEAIVAVASARQLDRELIKERLSSGELVTNVYALKLIYQTGRTEFVAGVNAPSSEVAKIAILQKGKKYTFPDVITHARDEEH